MEHEPQASPEQQSNSAELGQEVEELNRRLERRMEQAETAPEDQERQAEVARAKIEQVAVEPSQTETAPPPPSHPTRLDKLLNYRHTLASVQRRLTPVSRSFSKVIHTPAVEAASEVMEKTVLRPSIALGASTAACVIGGVFYLTARYYGFRLSGWEFLLALIAGGVIGLALEFISKLWRRRP